MIFIRHHPMCGWGSAAGFVPVGRAAVCPVAPAPGDSLWTAQDTEWGTWIRGGWVGFPPQGALQWCSFTKCCCCFEWAGLCVLQSRRLQAGPSCLGVSLPSAEQMILAPELLCLYPTNVFASKSGVHVVFAVTVLTLNIFPYFVFCKRAVCPKDTIWLQVIKSIFQPGLKKICESFTLCMWHSTSA